MPPLAVDAGIALVCWINVIIQASMDGHLTGPVVTLATANVLPLLWRRRYPLLVTTACGVTTTWLAVMGAAGDLPAAQLVVTYTFAALCPPVQRLVAVAGTVLGITLSIVIPKESVLNLGVVGIAFAVAYALGTAGRARRDRITMLEERTRRLAGEQDAAATRERERIAREMHDILAHSMSMVVIQAEAGPVAVRTDPDKAEEAFDSISETAREALAQLRRALGVLRSDSAERRPQPGLEALPELVAGIRRTGLTVTLEEDGEPRPVPTDLAATAYRIVQESLTNTVKHAAASSVRVRLGWPAGALRLEVCDDGSGPAGDGEVEGHGLVGMRERVATAGGELSLGPGPGGIGYRVAASLPLR
jgi:signal transduction histidine kinase